MGFQPGVPRHPNAGRKKGTPNKATIAVAEKLAALNFDPFLLMVELAKDENNSPELRGKMAAELASFLAPKRKAQEVELNAEVNVHKTVSDEPLSIPEWEAAYGVADTAH
jgi:hypothetical protein